jgi:hypothetical protein
MIQVPCEFVWKHYGDMARKMAKSFQVHVVEVAVGDEDEIQRRKVRERNARGFVPFQNKKAFWVKRVSEKILFVEAD